MTRHFLFIRHALRLFRAGTPLGYTMREHSESAGFTLVETLLAVSLLCVAVTAPMLLTVQSLSSAYYARDQIVAFHLAQEGIEAVHSIRDGQILRIATTPSGASGINLFGTLGDEGRSNGDPFFIDITTGAIQNCSGPCPSLRTNDVLYGYDSSLYPKVTNFTRTMTICYVKQDTGECDFGASSSLDSPDEVRITSTVSWHTASYQVRTFSISENLYRWVNDGT